MRFLHSIPLPLLLILSSLVSFESQITSPAVPDNEEPTLADNRSPNDSGFDNLTYVFDNYDKVAEQYRRKDNADVVKPLSLENEGSSEPTITDNYNELSADELNTKLALEEANARKLNEAIAAENAKLEQKVKDAEEPFKKYNEAEAEWERLDGIYKEKNKERLELVYKAGNATKDWKEANEAYAKINKIVAAQVQLEQDIEKAKKDVENLEKNGAYLTKALDRKAELPGIIETQTKHVGSLFDGITTANGPLEDAQNDFNTFQVDYNTKNCAVSGHSDCPDIIKSLNSANATLLLAKGASDQAKEEHRLANEKLDQLQNEEAELPEKIRQLEKNKRNMETYLTDAKNEVNYFLEMQRKEETPLAETRILNETAAATLAQATDRKTLAEKNFAEYPEENIRTEKKAATVALSEYKRAKKIRDPLNDEIEEMKTHLKELQTQRDQSIERVSSLKRIHEAKTSQNPKTGGFPIWIAAVIGALVLAAIVILAVVLIKRRKRKEHKEEKVATDSQASHVPPQDSVPNTASSVSQLPQSTPGTPAGEYPGPSTPVGESISNTQLATALAGSDSNTQLATTQVAGSASNTQLATTPVADSNLATAKSREPEAKPATDNQQPRQIMPPIEERLDWEIELDANKLNDATEEQRKLKKFVIDRHYEGRSILNTNDVLIYTNKGGKRVRLMRNGVESEVIPGSALKFVDDNESMPWLTAKAVPEDQKFNGLIDNVFVVRSDDKGRETPAERKIRKIEFKNNQDNCIKKVHELNEERASAGEEDDSQPENEKSGAENEDKSTQKTAVAKKAKKPSKKKNVGKKKSVSKQSSMKLNSKGEEKKPRTASQKAYIVSHNHKNQKKNRNQTVEYNRMGIPRIKYKKIDATMKDIEANHGSMLTRETLTEFVNDIVAKFDKGEPIKFDKQTNFVVSLIWQRKSRFKSESKILRIEGPLYIVGDLHGNLDNLLAFFAKTGGLFSEAWKKAQWLFLGDYVDRGKYSTAMLNLLLALKALYPENIHLLRGNHETFSVNFRYGFRSDLIKEFGPKPGQMLYEGYNSMFSDMPLAAFSIAAAKLFCMHGGISEDLLKRSLDEIMKHLKNISVNGIEDTEDDPITRDLTWADPTWQSGLLGLLWYLGRRSEASSFTIEAVEKLCEHFGVDAIVRAHQMVYNGFEMIGKTATVFSASSYEPEHKNKNFASFMYNGDKDSGVGLSVIAVVPTKFTEKEIRAKWNYRHSLTAFDGATKQAQPEDTSETIQDEMHAKKA